uniref:Serpentine Receptor, class H n=1 Tax=Caenorhabditis tropicalis TaxID=1561998 RepID=A0A1I7T1G3_9PELO
MKKLKWFLINLQIWIACFDYTITFFVIPVLLLPTFMGFPLGILKYVNVNFVLPSLLGLIFLGYVLVSIVAIFENQFHTILTISRVTNWTKWRRPCLIFHYVLVFLGVSSFIFFVPEQEGAVQRALQRIPCLPSYVFDRTLYVFAEQSAYHITLFSIFNILVSVEVFILMKLLVQNVREQMKDRRMSTKTYKLQKKLFIALAIQSFLPLTLIVIPCIYTLIMVIFEYYNQAYSSVALIMGSLHGIISTLVMLFIHHPYREAMRMSFFGKNGLGIRRNTVLISSVVPT